VKTAFRAGDLQARAAAAGAWLDASAANLARGSLANALRAAIASVIARDAGAPLERDAFAAALARTRSLDDLAACGGPLVLLFGLAAARIGADAGAALRQFVDASEAAFDADRPDRDQFCAAAYLLAQLGGAVRPLGATQPAEMQTIENDGDRDDLRAIGWVECAAAFGTRRAAAPPALALRLQAAAMLRLKRYEFELGCRAARAAHYADGSITLARAATAAFLRAHQDFDGSFGFFDREAAELRRATRADHAALEFKVPATLASLWTLAEFELANYRVFRDIGLASLARGTET